MAEIDEIVEAPLRLIAISPCRERDYTQKKDAAPPLFKSATDPFASRTNVEPVGENVVDTGR
jgi:hypothetical protein